MTSASLMSVKLNLVPKQAKAKMKKGLHDCFCAATFI